MSIDIQKYFKPDKCAFYETKQGYRGHRSIHNLYDNIRVNKAIEQAALEPVPISKVFSYVNDFLELVKLKNGLALKRSQVEQIKLDKEKQIIIDNGIIAVDCHWTEPIYDNELRKYTYYDRKYDIIKDKFDLRYPNDIIWLKFTVDGYVGVVAKSFDINFDYDTTSGELLRLVNKEWNSSFVLIFPLTQDILRYYDKRDLETAIGNYLIEKKVPIIDYYSHNY